MEKKYLFGLAMMVVGIIMVVRGLTAEHLYNDTEGPVPEEEIKKYKARPKDRLFAVGVGILCVVLGLLNLLR